MTGIREIIFVLIVVTGLGTLALVSTGQPSAQAASGHHSAAQGAHRTCDPRVFHRIDKYTSWRYVSPLLARMEHVGRCSKVITGTDGSVIFSQRGYVTDVS